MSELVKNLIKTYKAYKTARWIALAGGVIGTGGALAVPAIVAAVVEELAERGVEELALDTTKKLFEVVAEKVDGETIYKLGEEVIASDKAKELITKGYEKEVGEGLGTILGSTAVGDIVLSGDVFLSANTAEKEDKAEPENESLKQACYFLINAFWLSGDEREKLNKHLDTIIKIDDILKRNEELKRLLGRLRKSNESHTKGRDLFDDNGQLNFGLT